jgi:hypothetical protein
MIWEQYKRTLIGMQVTIAAFTVGSYFVMYRSLAPALVFFTTMQIGAVAGAFWATKLKKRVR